MKDDYKQTNILLESGTNELEIVEFQIVKPKDDSYKKDGDFYGINVAKVREIITMPEVTELPRAHPCVKGVFNLRGRVIPLIDLGHWIQNAQSKPDESKKRVIVTEFNGIYNGFSVYSVSRIHRISWKQVTSPSDIIEEGGSDCIVGVIKFENKIVMLLDFEKILSDINPSISIRKVPSTDGDLEKRKGKKILVAEDSNFIRRSVIDSLTSAGYQVEAFSNGAEALTKIKEHATYAKNNNYQISDMFQLLITDIEMPQMDGLHLTKNLRDDLFFKDLPIIVYSSIANDENKRKAASVGATGFIGKPELERLVQLIDALLAR
ncbi:MAG: chemotaxis protein CheV [Nitrospinae bacterium]|nr:chemotaxis protein CheV [Nitrospinota bacterium]